MAPRPRQGFKNKGKSGAGPSSWSTSIGKATNAFRNKRKVRSPKPAGYSKRRV